MRRFALLAFALVGCRHELAQPWCVEDPNDPRCIETASGGDTGVVDTGGVDSGTADVDVPEADTRPPSCAAAGAASEACGKCGTRTRTCIADGTWSEWGACESEGVCTPDEVETLGAACPGALEKRTRKCSASCAWEAEVCALPKGWTAIAEPPAGFEGRMYASAIWTGGEMIVYGGRQSESGPGLNDGAIYSIAKNAWTVLPTPSFSMRGRSWATAVWDGLRYMYAWGGADGSTALADGAVYDASAKSWNQIPAAPLAARQGHGAVWSTTTSEMLVWGGEGEGTHADGAALNKGYTWTKLPPAPIAARSFALTLWTGTEMLVWGGRDGSTRFDDGALYDPVKKTWRLLPASGRAPRILAHGGLTAGAFVFFGGFADPLPNDGAVLSIGATPTWTPIPEPPLEVLTPRLFGAAWFEGGRLMLWSGASSTSATLENDGAVYDTASKTWSHLDAAGAPVGRANPTVVSTGTGAIVWSGFGKPGGGITELLTSGGLYVQ